jgi:transposase
MRKANYPIELSANDRQELERMLRGGQQQARILRRVQILLWSDEGKTDCEIAELLKVTAYTVGQTRERWVKEHTLADRPRPGRHPKTDGKQDAFLVALACSAAPDGQEQWTMQLLADRMVELGVVEEPLSDETVRRRLKKWRSNPG